MNFIKKQIGRIDRKLLGGRLNEKRLASYRKRDLSCGFTAQYKKCDSSLLNILCDKYGSDKGEVNELNNPYAWPSHNYADVYELMFRLRRNDVDLIVECGLGTNNPDLKSSMGINGKPGATRSSSTNSFSSARSAFSVSD